MASQDGKIRKEDLVESGASNVYKELADEGIKNLKRLATELDGLSKSLNKVGVSANEVSNINKKTAKTLKEVADSSNNVANANKKVVKSTDENTRAIQSQEKASKGLIVTFKNLLQSMVAFIGVRMFIQTIKDTFELVKTLDSLRFAMKSIIKDTIELGQTQDWLKEITNKYGAELVNTTERYIKFRAAAIQSNLSAKDTQEIFGTMTKAAGVLGLKTDELAGIYLALEQMLSKGKVTTEELRRQLGERLPGAMGIMADALGVTIPKLDEMLKKGQVLSAETLPKFAKQVEIAFGLESINRVDTLAASTARLKNSWTILVSEFTQGNDISKKLSLAINFVAENLETLIVNALRAVKAFVIYKALMIGYSAVLQIARARLIALTFIESARTIGLKAATAQMWKLNVATAANPIGALVTVLVAAVAILWSFKDVLDFATISQERLAEAIEKTKAEQEKLNAQILSNRNSQIKAIDDYYNTLIAGSKNENDIDELKKAQSAAKIILLESELETVRKNIEAYNESLKSFEKGTEAYEIRNTVIQIQSERYLELLDIIGKLKIADLGLSDATEGSVAWYRKQISSVTALIELEKNRAKIIPIQAEVNRLQEKLNALLGIENSERAKRAKVEAINTEVMKQQLFGSIKYLEEMISDNKILIDLSTDQTTRDKLKQENEALQLMIDRMNGVRDLTQKLADTRGASFKIEPDLSGLDVALIQIGNFLDKYADLVREGIGASADLFDAISARRIENIEAEINAEEKKYDRLLQLAGNDAEQKAALEKQRDDRLKILEKKRLKELQKAAKQKKAFALADIAINTAVAISEASPNVFKIVAASILGALQVATVLATPIPQFAQGGTMGWDGKAMINDGGNREYVERNGVILSSPIKNAVVDLQKGDTIHKDYNSLMNASIMTSLANDNKNLDSSRLKLIFDDNYANLENVIGKSLSKAKFNNNISLNGFDKNQELYKNSLSRWN